MKKKLGILIGGAMTVFCLSSCSAKSSGIISLNIWTYYNTSTQESFAKMVESFNTTEGADKGIVLSTKSQGSYVSDLTSALIKSASNQPGAEEMPDLFISYADTAYELDGLGKIAAIDSYFSEAELKEFYPGFVQEGRFDEKKSLKILPVAKSTEALYVNKTDFDKFLSDNPNIGVGYEDLSTWEGVMRVSEAYFSKTGNAFFGRDSIDNYFVIGAKQLGIELFDYNNSVYSITKNKEVFHKLWESYYIPYVKGHFAAVGKFRSTDIQAGTILAYVGSTSSGGYFPGKVETKDGSYPISSYVTCVPVFEGKDKIAVSQGAGFCVTKSTKEKEEASVAFLKWLTKKENITSFASNSGYFPATSNGFSQEFIDSQKNDHYKANFTICKKTLEEYTMYTNIVGPSSNKYRDDLKLSLENLCKSSRAKVVEGGCTEEIIAQYTAEKVFEDWFNSIA